MNTLYNVLPSVNESIESEYWTMVRMDDYPQLLHRYTISTYGRVCDCVENKIIAPRVLESENKYLNASMRLIDGGMRTFDIHRMMLITFKPNIFASEMVCNHIDGVKCHNWIWNLEWTTTRGNTVHAINNGLISMGTDRANGIVPESFIREICKLIQDGYSTQDIMNMIVPPVECNFRRLIQNIKNGHCHSNISKEYDFSNAYDVNINDRRFTSDQIEQICSMFEKYGKDYSTSNICASLCIDFYSLDEKAKKRYFAAISGIRNKKKFIDICNKYNY